MRLDKYLKEDRIELEFTTDKEEKWAKQLSTKWNKDANFSFFTDAVLINATPQVMNKIRLEISKASKKLKGLYINEAVRKTAFGEEEWVKDIDTFYKRLKKYWNKTIYVALILDSGTFDIRVGKSYKDTVENLNRELESWGSRVQKIRFSTRDMSIVLKT